MQATQRLAGALGEHAEEPARGGRAGDRLDAQHLLHGGFALRPRYVRDLVRAAEKAADVTQCDLSGIVGIWAGGIVRQHLPQLLAEALLPQKVRPDEEAAVR